MLTPRPPSPFPTRRQSLTTCASCTAARPSRARDGSVARTSTATTTGAGCAGCGTSSAEGTQSSARCGGSFANATGSEPRCRSRRDGRLAHGRTTCRGSRKRAISACPGGRTRVAAQLRNRRCRNETASGPRVSRCLWGRARLLRIVRGRGNRWRWQSSSQWGEKGEGRTTGEGSGCFAMRAAVLMHERPEGCAVREKGTDEEGDEIKGGF